MTYRIKVRMMPSQQDPYIGWATQVSQWPSVRKDANRSTATTKIALVRIAFCHSKAIVEQNNAL
jgi:hypothetical protein